MEFKANSHEARLSTDKAVIYVLIDPRDGEIHYVGCSLYPNFRYAMHLSPSSGIKGSRRSNWIAELRALGLRPIGESLITMPTTQKYWIEEETWVRRLTLAGCELYNNTARERNIIQSAKSLRESKEGRP